MLCSGITNQFMPYHIGNQNSIGLLRLATFSSFIEHSHSLLVFAGLIKINK